MTIAAALRPFPTGGIVKSDDIVGRVSYIEQTVMRLMMGQSVVIAGPRQTGKSSVAREVLHRLQAEGHYTTAVDLFAVHSIEDWAAQLVQAILANRIPTESGPRVHCFAELRMWLESTDVKATLLDIEMDLDWSGTEDGARQNILRALELAETLAKQDGRHMTIMFDNSHEIQRLSRLARTDLVRQFRAIAQRQRHTTYLFVGRTPQLLTTTQQALYGFAMSFPLPEVPNDAWESYIEHKLSSRGMTITKAAFRTMLDLTEGHPQCLMDLASHAYFIAASSGSELIDAEIVTDANYQLMEHRSRIYEQQWLSARRVKHADAICLAISQCESAYAYSSVRSRPSISRALEHLLHMGIVEQQHPWRNKEHVLADPMFSRWVQSRFGQCRAPVDPWAL